jgi:hypothetical protein
MTKSSAQIAIIVSGVVFVLLFSCCRQSPDGKTVFLRSEAALDAVRSLRMHIEIRTALPMTTDAEFSCDQDETRYVTIQVLPQAPSLKKEYIQTARFLFARVLEPEPSVWARSRRQPLLGVCERLKTPDNQNVASNRLITADQTKSLPPFSSYAKDEASIFTYDGNESIEGVPCEIWTVRNSVTSADAPHTIWIAARDRLPRKYLEGHRDNPITIVTYSDYGQAIPMQLPPSDMGY